MDTDMSSSLIDLNNSFKYDKVIVNLNNHNCLTINPNETSFHVNLVEPIKNIVYIKLLKASIITTSAIKNNNQLLYIKYDPIYISINDYERSQSYLNTNGVFDIVKYFDFIPYSTDTFSDISNSHVSFDWTDSSVYILNPPEPNLKRLNIVFRDKYFKTFNTSILTHFNLSICLYYVKNRA
jgi:hypothetical protein